MPVDHYENFPVASVLLPARLRPPVEAIYAFARSADDIADEGDATPEERLASLQEYEQELDRIESGVTPSTRLFQKLTTMVAEHALPLQPMRDLLSAFKQDVVVKRYAGYADLLDYCRRSANPVGRLMLHLFGAADESHCRQSDAVCTALQLINFWQDVAVDWDKGRIYLPLEDMQRFGVAQSDIAGGVADERWRALMAFEVARARALMQEGAPLALRMRGRIGWELRLIVQGGLHILDAIEAADYDVFRHRPTLGKADWLRLAWRALTMRGQRVAEPVSKPGSRLR
ncbi:squalene synthase HpnC [Noviherbaspirillum pedocola]|uniref:Squalene synthase HpnC n=1 Tax=Noviherbaspirillum pedocola TaxID=2801341 RepID=A0A934SUY8_9BURK|nr:squalene synthase HpnC [Noviherbaspirillum pedocola]MBK4735783.1 squalene synthase HpnC [Noviherbaspirillum pedocola]